MPLCARRSPCSGSRRSPKREDRCVTVTGSSSRSWNDAAAGCDQRSIVVSKSAPPDGSAPPWGGAVPSGRGRLGSAFATVAAADGSADETPRAVITAIRDDIMRRPYHACRETIRDRNDSRRAGEPRSPRQSATEPPPPQDRSQSIICPPDPSATSFESRGTGRSLRRYRQPQPSLRQQDRNTLVPVNFITHQV